MTAAKINASNDVMTSPLIIRTNAMASRLEEGYNVEGFVALSSPKIISTVQHDTVYDCMYPIQ